MGKKSKSKSPKGAHSNQDNKENERYVTNSNTENTKSRRFANRSEDIQKMREEYSSLVEEKDELIKQRDRLVVMTQILHTYSTEPSATIDPVVAPVEAPIEDKKQEHRCKDAAISLLEENSNLRCKNKALMKRLQELRRARSNVPFCRFLEILALNENMIKVGEDGCSQDLKINILNGFTYVSANLMEETAKSIRGFVSQETNASISELTPEDAIRDMFHLSDICNINKTEEIESIPKESIDALIESWDTVAKSVIQGTGTC